MLVTSVFSFFKDAFLKDVNHKAIQGRLSCHPLLNEKIVYQTKSRAFADQNRNATKKLKLDLLGVGGGGGGVRKDRGNSWLSVFLCYPVFLKGFFLKVATSCNCEVKG